MGIAEALKFKRVVHMLNQRLVLFVIFTGLKDLVTNEYVVKSRMFAADSFITADCRISWTEIVFVKR